jgi:hypothetical protein
MKKGQNKKPFSAKEEGFFGNKFELVFIGL